MHFFLFPNFFLSFFCEKTVDARFLFSDYRFFSQEHYFRDFFFFSCFPIFFLCKDIEFRIFFCDNKFRFFILCLQANTKNLFTPQNFFGCDFYLPISNRNCENRCLEGLALNSNTEIRGGEKLLFTLRKNSFHVKSD